MKILIANYRYFISSGPERYLFNITDRLERDGHAVYPFSIGYRQNVETPFSRYFVPPIGEEDEVYFDQHRNSLSAMPRTLSRLFYSREVEHAVMRMAEEVQPDIAYVLYFLRKLSPSLLVGLKKRGLPIVARISDYGLFCAEHHCLREGEPCTLCVGGNLLHSVAHRCVKGSRAISLLDAAASYFHRSRGFFDLIDAFVVTNEFMRSMLIRAGFPPERLHTIATFTDLERFRPGEPPAAAPLLYLGRLDPPKGVHVLIEAMAHLAQAGRAQPSLVIAGAGHDPRYVEQLKARVSEAGLGARITFLGEVTGETVPALYRGALATVIPALWYENLPNVAVESLASGVPVIASRIGSLADTIHDGLDGLHFTPGDPQALADAITRIAADPALRARLGAGARQTALDQHAPEKHVESLMQVFETLLAPQSVLRPLVPA